MARKSNAAAAIESSAVTSTVAAVAETSLAPALRTIVREIDGLFNDAQTTSLRAFWQIGKHIADVATDPDSYLTDEQKDAQVDPAALLISIFSPVYSADQLRSAEAFYDKYPTERELNRLLALRSEENPRWRLSTSHVQLLTQVSDDDQRTALEEKCADEALTAKTLAKELQDLRGKKPGGGRKHESPKGLKNQLYDLLHHIRRFVARSESLWLGDDSVYDQFMNAAPARREGVPQQHFDEIAEMLTKLSDVVGDHIGMVNKVLEALRPAKETDENADDAEDEAEDSDDSDDMVADARRAAAAAAASRKRNKITR